jgi:hypothetical protein
MDTSQLIYALAAGIGMLVAFLLAVVPTALEFQDSADPASA